MPEPDGLDPEIAESLTGLPMADVRARRAACQTVETELSYVRRLVQGRLDIVRYELSRRSAGGEHDLPDIVDHLRDILADGTWSPGNGHLPTVDAPGTVDARLLARLDEIAEPGRLSDPAVMDEAELARTADDLAGFERELSDRRRQVFGRIDAIQEEMVRRYRTGEANVDTLFGRG
jgi:hypothetical protein